MILNSLRLRSFSLSSMRRGSYKRRSWSNKGSCFLMEEKWSNFWMLSSGVSTWNLVLPLPSWNSNRKSIQFFLPSQLHPLAVPTQGILCGRSLISCRARNSTSLVLIIWCRRASQAIPIWICRFDRPRRLVTSMDTHMLDRTWGFLCGDFSEPMVGIDRCAWVQAGSYFHLGLRMVYWPTCGWCFVVFLPNMDLIGLRLFAKGYNCLQNAPGFWA